MSLINNWHCLKHRISIIEIEKGFHLDIDETVYMKNAYAFN